MLRRFFTTKWILTTLLVFVGTAVCVRLGVWQLERLEQKRAENAHFLAVAAMDELVLTARPTQDLTGMEFRRVRAVGVYDFENQVALRNHYRENELGYRLLTPLILVDGTAILIERGWVPAEGNKNPSDWRQYDQPGEVTVRGILRLGRAEPDMGGVPDPTLQPGQNRLDFWNMVNTERISLQIPAPLLPVYIQPDLNETRAIPPYPAQAQYEVTERSHFGYAMQWFIFAALLFFGYPFFLLGQLRQLVE